MYINVYFVMSVFVIESATRLTLMCILLYYYFVLKVPDVLNYV